MKFRFVSFLIYHMVRLVALTLRLRVVGEDQIARVQESTGKGVILVTWHGRTLLPVARFQRRGYWAIISTSRDGEYQDRIFQRFGFRTVRGSTSARGAVQAALAMTKHLKNGAVLAFTPDGPRGPSRQLQPGAMFLAQKSGCPIIPVGVSAAPRKLMPAWDRYLLPLPFARAAILFGPPIFIPAEAKSEEEQQYWRERITAEINLLEQRAEQEVGIKTPDSETQQGAGLWRRA